jgi:hypothetical protein
MFEQIFWNIDDLHQDARFSSEPGNTELMSLLLFLK